MAKRYKVVLRGCETFSGRYGDWKKGQSQDVDEGEASYYKGQSEFVVTELGDVPAVAAPASAPAAETEEPVLFTEAELKKAVKTELLEIGAQLGLTLSEKTSNAGLIRAILRKQEAQQEG